MTVIDILEGNRYPISKEFESDHTNAMLSLERHRDEGERLDEILTKF